MWPAAVSLMRSRIALTVVVFPDPAGPVTSDQAARLDRHALDDRRQAEWSHGGMPDTTQRNTRPTEPRWRYTLTRKRPRPGTLWAKSASPVLANSSARRRGRISSAICSVSPGSTASKGAGGAGRRSGRTAASRPSRAGRTRASPSGNAATRAGRSRPAPPIGPDVTARRLGYPSPRRACRLERGAHDFAARDRRRWAARERGARRPARRRRRRPSRSSASRS